MEQIYITIIEGARCRWHLSGADRNGVERVKFPTGGKVRKLKSMSWCNSSTDCKHGVTSAVTYLVYKRVGNVLRGIIVPQARVRTQSV